MPRQLWRDFGPCSQVVFLALFVLSTTTVATAEHHYRHQRDRAPNWEWADVRLKKVHVYQSDFAELEFEQAAAVGPRQYLMSGNKHEIPGDGDTDDLLRSLYILTEQGDYRPAQPGDWLIEREHHKNENWSWRLTLLFPAAEQDKRRIGFRIRLRNSPWQLTYRFDLQENFFAPSAGSPAVSSLGTAPSAYAVVRNSTPCRWDNVDVVVHSGRSPQGDVIVSSAASNPVELPDANPNQTALVMLPRFPCLMPTYRCKVWLEYVAGQADSHPQWKVAIQGVNKADFEGLGDANPTMPVYRGASMCPLAQLDLSNSNPGVLTSLSGAIENKIAIYETGGHQAIAEIFQGMSVDGKFKYDETTKYKYKYEVVDAGPGQSLIWLVAIASTKQPPAQVGTPPFVDPQVRLVKWNCAAPLDPAADPIVPLRDMSFEVTLTLHGRTGDLEDEKKWDQKAIQNFASQLKSPAPSNIKERFDRIAADRLTQEGMISDRLRTLSRRNLYNLNQNRVTSPAIYQTYLGYIHDDDDKVRNATGRVDAVVQDQMDQIRALNLIMPYDPPAKQTAADTAASPGS